jgi:nucleoside-diphosphate-sugar epimerase
MNILITGATGFIGSHFMEFCLDKGDVWGNWWKGEDQERLRDIKDKINLVECDVTNYEQVYNMIEKSKPDKIFHLAAQSSPFVSWKKPFETIVANMGGTINIYEAVRKLKLDPVTVVAGSSDEYGQFPEDGTKVDESYRLKPLNVYAISKVGQDQLSHQYFHSYKMKNVCIRIFNTTGTKKTGDVTSDFAKQIAEIELGLRVLKQQET